MILWVCSVAIDEELKNSLKKNSDEETLDVLGG